MHLLSARIVLAPGGHELREVVGAEDRRVAGQVVETKQSSATRHIKLIILAGVLNKLIKCDWV